MDEQAQVGGLILKPMISAAALAWSWLAVGLPPAMAQGLPTADESWGDTVRRLHVAMWRSTHQFVPSAHQADRAVSRRRWLSGWGWCWRRWWRVALGDALGWDLPTHVMSG